MTIKFKACNASNYRAGRTSPIKYIAIHYTAGNGDTAENNAVYYGSKYVGASAHYFVDESDTVYQSVKDTDTAWAVGGTSRYKHPDCRNSNSISIEMCSRNKNGSDRPATDNGWYFKPETVDNAVELTKELMQKYNIPIENVIRHFDVWDKICPAPFVNNPEQWEDFKKRLEEKPMTSEERKKFDTLVGIVSDLKLAVEELQKQNKVYHYFDELPDYAKSTLYDKGIYKGASASDLNLPETLMRTLVVNYRAEVYR